MRKTDTQTFVENVSKIKPSRTTKSCLEFNAVESDSNYLNATLLKLDMSL